MPLRLASTITADIVSDVSGIINRHKDGRDKKAISAELNKLIEVKVNKALQEELSQFVAELKHTSSTLSADALGEFEALTIDIEQVKGSVSKSVTTFAGGFGGAWGGAALGSMLLPGIGTVIGGVLGGLFGSAAGSTAGDYFVETEVITESVGVSTEKIITKTSDSIKKLLPNMIEVTFADVIKMIQPVEKLCEDLEQVIQRFSTDIDTLRG